MVANVSSIVLIFSSLCYFYATCRVGYILLFVCFLFIPTPIPMGIFLPKHNKSNPTTSPGSERTAASKGGGARKARRVCHLGRLAGDQGIWEEACEQYPSISRRPPAISPSDPTRQMPDPCISQTIVWRDCECLSSYPPHYHHPSHLYCMTRCHTNPSSNVPLHVKTELRGGYLAYWTRARPPNTHAGSLSQASFCLVFNGLMEEI